jgi:addiction module HigA family antidote
MDNLRITVLPDHPGKVLKRQLALFNRSTAEIARMLVLSRQALHELQAGKQAITPGVALKIAKLTGTRAESWLNLQQAYDLAVARSKMREILPQVGVLDEPW